MNPGRLARVLSGALLLAALAPAAAAAAVEAHIDGAPLYAFSVDAMWRMTQAKQPRATRRQALDQLIENRLLARAARRRFGENVLSSGQAVGFAREVGFDERLVSTLRAQYGAQMEQDLARLPRAGIDAMLREKKRPDPAQLDAVFGAPAGLALESVLSEAQQQRTRKIVLLRYALPGEAERAITLFDVYQRQNVQGRVALFARDVDFMLQQAALEVGAQYVLSWSTRRFGSEPVADLRRVLSEQADTQALLRIHGMGDDAHDDGPLLDQLARAVSPAQVRRHYHRHRQQFLRIEKVRARHIRLADEAAAHKVAAALAAGADFADLARRHSVAPDAARAGALGWVRHDSAPSWLAQLLFAHADGKVSPPVRTPVGPHEQAAWEIVQVQQRVQGYQRSDSESVRYVASRAIARQTAIAQLASLRKQVLRSARIGIVRATEGSSS